MTSIELSEPHVGDAAPDVTLPDQTGTPVSFSSIWSRQAAIFVFLRHFG